MKNFIVDIAVIFVGGVIALTFFPDYFLLCMVILIICDIIANIMPSFFTELLGSLGDIF
jgi:hypothetical protein